MVSCTIVCWGKFKKTYDAQVISLSSVQVPASPAATRNSPEKKKQFCFQVADLAPPLQIQLFQLQIAVHPKDSRKRDFPLSYWCAVSGLRRESVCSAASNRLPFATNDANVSTYHGNGDTTASLLAAQSRNPADTPGVFSTSVWCHHSDEWNWLLYGE